MSTCDLSPEDLIAYEDGSLTGVHRTLVEAHVRACAHCQAKLAAFREVDRILQEGAAVEDPVERAATRARIERQLTQARSAGRRRSRLAPRTIVVAMFLLTLAIWPSPSGAGFRLGEFIRGNIPHIERFSSGEGGPRRLTGVATAPSGEASLHFQPVEPAQLPLGLVRVERGVPISDRLELLYRNGDDTAILLAETPARPSVVAREPGNDEVITVRGTEVLWLKDPRPEAVAGLLWERDGIFFELLVTEPPIGGLLLPDAIAIVEALMDE